MIIGEIRRYLRDNNPIRVSRSVRDLAYKAIQVKDSMTKEKGAEPTIEEIMLSFDAIQIPISLKEPVYKDGTENIYVMDQVKDNKNTDEKWTEDLSIAESMKKLNEREKDIIERRYGLLTDKEVTQKEIAECLGISRSYVSRIEKRALTKLLREFIKNKNN